MRYVALALAVLAGVSAQAQTINFDNLPGMTFWAGNPVPTESRLSNQLASLGVKFSSTAPYCAVVNLDTMATSMPNGIAGASAQGLLSYAEVNPVVITFCYPGRPETQGITDYVRIRGDRAFSGGETVATMKAYDVHGTLVATGYMPDTGQSDLSVTTAMRIIHRVVITGSVGDTGGVGLDDLQFTTPNAYGELSGRIVFRNLEFGATPPASALFEFRAAGTTNVLATLTVDLSPTGEFVVLSPVPPGMVDLSVKDSHWLRRTIPVDTTNGGVSGLVFTLRNGDADGDNEIGIGDYAILSGAYGSNPGFPNWQAMSDFNRDTEVDIVDYAIMSQSYGLVGDD